MNELSGSLPSQSEIDDESRRVRRLRISVTLALQVIAQGEISLEEATELASAARRVALQLFPGRGDVFDLLYRPKFRRLINEIYRLQ
jgi:predicted HTH domain antitoxin